MHSCFEGNISSMGSSMEKQYRNRGDDWKNFTAAQIFDKHKSLAAFNVHCEALPVNYNSQSNS